MSDYLTIREVCDKVRIVERTAYELCRSGKLPGAVKVGGQWRVERVAFEAWLKSGGDTPRRTPKSPERQEGSA